LRSWFAACEVSHSVRFFGNHMDASERIVKEHLKYRGYVDVIYEPDGNVPPDFLANGSIAIEVRRLNQNYFDGARAKGLEEVAIPLWDRVKNLLTSMGPPVNGETWFVYFRFNRPVELWKHLEPKLRCGLESFMKSSAQSPGVVAAGQGFELEVFCQASKPHQTMFIMAGCLDRESGGWVLAEMETNLRYCVSEKTRKVAKVKSRYPVWWLALVDYIGYSLNDFDREIFRAQVSIEHTWDKIILIDPGNHRDWFEI